MRALDTNVLLRYLTGDDPRQHTIARRTLDECASIQEPAFLPVLVICEAVWVLAHSHGLGKAHVLAVVEDLLDTDMFHIEREDVVRRALEACRTGKGNFSDYVIGAIAAHHGCRDTVTFDKALKGAGGFTVLA